MPRVSAPSSVVAKLASLIAHPESLRQLLHCQGRDAQELLDLFQWLLDSPDLDEQLRKHLIVSAQRISVRTGQYPICYELKDEIEDAIQSGAGGQADIYNGRIKDRCVCLKVMRVFERMDKELVLKQFWKEAILWRQLSHPNILPVYGLYRFLDRPCFVAPWMENGSVNKYLKINPEAPRLPLAVGVARGLYYLHSKEVIHGDLKGSNILVDDEGIARVADFGLSSISDPQILTLTSHSGVASKGGTVRWQAPELFDMQNDIIVKNSKPSDVYAWGCVCYEIFTGRLPLDHLINDAAIMYNIKMGARPNRPPSSSQAWNSWGLTEDIWSIMEDCWIAQPDDRPTISSILNRFCAHERDSTVDVQYSPNLFRAMINEALSDDRIISTRVLDSITSRHLITRLDVIFGDNSQYERLLETRGTEAQKLLDTFQTLLDTPGITSESKHDIIVATQRLSQRSGLLPKTYIHQDIQMIWNGPIDGGQPVNLYKGYYSGRAVGLKPLRVHRNTTLESFVKHISNDDVQKLVLWSQLSHENLLPVFGMSYFKTYICLVSPWMENGTILQFLRAFPDANRVILLSKVASGIAYLHDNDIVHGNLQAAHVLVDEREIPRLAHFGFKSTDVTNGSSTFADSMSRWQAPELLHSTRTSRRSETRASDVYAFAGIAYEVTHNWQGRGSTRDIWPLMGPCWSIDPSRRPNIHEVVSTLQYKISEEDLPIGGDDPGLTPASFRDLVGGRPEMLAPSDFDALLEGKVIDVMEEA